MDDRRSNIRCPICQGPTKEDSSHPEGVRCRRSICSFNHEHIACPRCESNEHEVTSSGENFAYTCSMCLHKFTI